MDNEKRRWQNKSNKHVYLIIVCSRFASSVNPCGFVSFGGGSVMDTCKAANLYSTHPPVDGDFLAYVNKPLVNDKNKTLFN